MGVRTLAAKEITCDACGATQYALSVGDVYGVAGKLTVTHTGGGFTIDVFSCEASSEHITDAIMGAIKKEQERG